MFENLYRPVADLLLNRYPIKVRAEVSKEPPTIVLCITNQTSNIPVHIHQVRVHYGSKQHSRAFHFPPHGTVEIKPKATAEWILSFEPYETRISLRYLTKTPPAEFNSTGPGIDSPGQLFNAIGMGNKNLSWVEVDFNEYEEREFLRGKIQGVFDIGGKQLRARRER